MSFNSRDLSYGPSQTIYEDLRPSLTMLLPVHNEADTIEHVISDFYNNVAGPTGAETVICEDGSTDGTNEILHRIAEEYPIRLLVDHRRKGYASAVKDGLRHIHTDIAFFADSDGQYSAQDFWRLWPFIENCDMVIGRKLKRAEPLHRTVLSRGFHVLAKSLFNIPLRDIDCGFRLIRQNVLKEVLPKVRSLPFSFWAEFTIVAHHRGFRILEVPISHRKRLKGVTSIYTFERLPHIMIRQLLGLVALDSRLKNEGGSR